MAHFKIATLLLTSILPLALAACGGGGSSGGSGGGLTSTPPPPPDPVSSSMSSPLSAAPAGVASTTALASIGALNNVRWNAELKAYEVEISSQMARVVATSKAEFAEGGELVTSDGSKLPVHVQAWTGFAYTRSGAIASSSDSIAGGAFAFGLATPAGAVPTTGTASYAAQLTGGAYTSEGVPVWGLYGSATLNFDFAAGTLAGFMVPILNGPMEVPSLPRYNLSNTVFGTGSTTFSGAFDVAGPTSSSFQGQFTGPDAQELMAGFTAPYFDSFSSRWGVIHGVLAAKR